MAVKVKVKATGSDAKKIHQAFSEVMHNTPSIVKQTARKEGAKQAHKQEVAIALSKARKAGASVPDKSGSNYVSNNDLTIPKGVTGQGTTKWTRGGQHVKPSGQCDAGKNAQGLHDYPTHDQYVADRFPAVHMGDEQVRHEIEIETVKPVEWRKKINPTEQTRQRNNQTRDMRTNLGRGKSGIVSAEEENHVQEQR